MNKSSLNTIHPPVTVYVVTYNSSNTVVETLESIKGQTYKEIGLIVSDDCSTDNTVKMCEDWMTQNKARFLFTQILTTPINTGVSANVNRALDACKTDFCKGIAGDDKLLPECIEKNVCFMLGHPDSTVVFSKIRLFGRKRDVRRFIFPFDYSFFSKSAQEQNYYLKNIGNCVPAAAGFIRLESFRRYSIRCDERIPMLEDWPLWIMITDKGIRLDFFDSVTVLYRIHEKSLTTAKCTPFISVKSSRLVHLYYVFEEEYKVNNALAINKLAENEALMLEKSREYEVGKKVLYPIRKFTSSRFGAILIKPIKSIWRLF